MNIKMLHIKLFLFLPVLLALAFNASPLSANCLDLYNEDHSGGWNLIVSAVHHSADLQSTDQYLSGPAGTEDWEAVNDVDGELNGFYISATPPILGKRVTVDFLSLTGDLSGTFSTREISPTPEGPYYGKVEFDRDEWKIGADIFVLNAVYARLEYATFKMKGDWVYSDGSPNEPQKYEFDAYSIGAGFRRDYFLQPSTVPNRKFGILVKAFAGLLFLNYEHTEELTGASVETDDTGYELDAELLGTYQLDIGNDSFIFAGAGYTYRDSDDSSLALTQKGVTAKLGVRITF